ncbi:MAG TPA: glycosyltransferase family 4 protein [Vicinamibacterales bacterium]|nr:glycosyltransferase family 4 protein [Vicinamibacterales bacterium]
MTSRPTLLAVTSELPWPLSSGGHIRTFHLLKALARRFEVKLVVPSPRGEAEGRMTVARAGIRVHDVPIGPRRAITEAGRVAAAVLRAEPYVLYARHRRRSVMRAVIAEIARRPPDVVYLDHLDSLCYAGVAGRAPIVVDMHNVYSRLAERASREVDGFAKRIYLSGQAIMLGHKEQAAASMAHTIFACSDDEARYFRSLGANRVVVVPNGVDTSAFSSTSTRREGPPTILFIGALEWMPNISAVRFLARDVLPAVRARVPDARLLVVGRRPTAEVLALGDPGRVDIAADVPDVRPYWEQADVLAVPLETGGGTRIKILEAFAAGVPVVSTPVGCEGIDARHPEHLLIASRDRFADAVVASLGDSTGAVERAANARVLARQQYDWGAIGARAADTLEIATAKADRSHGGMTGLASFQAEAPAP